MATTLAAPPSNGVHGANHAPSSTDPNSSPLTPDNINSCVRDAQYAVRGEIVIRANELADKLRHGEDLGFEKIIFCNIGNPQPLGQQPMTFLRQVLTLCDYPQVCPKTLHACIGGRKGGTCRHHGHDTLTNPQLMKDPKTAVHFPADVIDRAQESGAATCSAIQWCVCVDARELDPRPVGSLFIWWWLLGALSSTGVECCMG